MSQTASGVHMDIYPAFPDFDLSEKERTEPDIDQMWRDDPRWVSHRLNGEGGGPGIFTAIALAETLEEFLNQPYDPTQVADWKAHLETAMKPYREEWERRMRETTGESGASK